MNRTALRLGVVTGAASLLLLGVGVAATAVARSGAHPATPDAVASTDAGPALEDDARVPGDGTEGSVEGPDGTRPEGGPGGHRAAPPGDGQLAVPPEQPRARDEDDDASVPPDGGRAGGEGSAGEDGETGEPKLAG